MPILALIVAWLPKLVGYAGSFITGGATVMLAVVAAVPATITAVGSFFANLAEALKNPVFALLFGASVAGASGFLYGLSFDAGIRTKIKRDAIASANYQADLAIAKMRKDYDAKLTQLTRRRK